jgi:O-antigen/teichoic acid export membrane protein
VHGTFWSLIGSVIFRGLALLSSIAVARFLGKETFGELGIVQSTLALVQVFSGLGLGLTTTKCVAEFRVKDPLKAGRIIACSSLAVGIASAIIAPALFFVAPWLAAQTLSAPHLSEFLRIGILAVFFGSLNGVQIGGLSGLEAFRSLTYTNFISGVASFPITVCPAYYFGLRGAVWGVVASLAVNSLVNHIVLHGVVRREGIRLALTASREEWKLLFGFSVPALLSSIVFAPANWLCNAILVNQPNGYAALGSFTAADKWRHLTTFLPSSLSSAVLPILSNLYGLENPRAYEKVFRANLLLNLAVVLAPVILLVAFSKKAMLAYGSQFTAAWPTLAILASSAVFMTLNNVLGQVLVSTGMIWTRFAFDALLAASLLLGSFWLIPLYAECGMAAANLAAYLFTAVSILILVKSRKFYLG